MKNLTTVAKQQNFIRFSNLELLGICQSVSAKFYCNRMRIEENLPFFL